MIRICKNCACEYNDNINGSSKKFCSLHCRCQYASKFLKKAEYGTWKCECGQIFDTRSQMKLHFKECGIHKKIAAKNKGWSKGLTAETDERVKNILTAVINAFKNGDIVRVGICKSEEAEKIRRQRISDSMKKAAKEGRNVGWASTRKQLGGMSFPEKYFDTVFSNAGLKYEINYPAGKYKLDFAFIDAKKYIEIDGELHYTPENIKKDEIRDLYLLNHNWTLIKRIRWSVFQKLSYEEKQKYINELLLLI